MPSEYQKSRYEEIQVGYVQGAGDDSEGWALGLTPILYWENHERLLAASEDELPDLISSLIAQAKLTNGAASGDFTLVGPQIAVGILTENLNWLEHGDIAIVCSYSDLYKLNPSQTRKVLNLQCGVGKLGSRDLRQQLDKIPIFLETSQTVNRVFVMCETGRDLSVGIALVLLCKYGDDAGKFFTKPMLAQAILKNIKDPSHLISQ